MDPVTNWESRYNNNDTSWDIGSISTPLKDYFDQLTDKSLRILIPGAGNGHEAEYLFNNGFKNVYILDIAPSPLNEFKKRNPEFPSNQLIEANFFNHKLSYDLIVEQTFFCAIDPKHRSQYSDKINELLKPRAKLVGLLFSVPLNNDKPPFGGSKEEYKSYFEKHFDFLHFENAYNSIQPRAGRELFLLAQKK